MSGRDVADLRSAESALANEFGAEIASVPIDLAGYGAPLSLAGQAADAFGGLDILVNNAGISHPEPVIDTDPDKFDATIAINLRAPALLASAVGKVMVAQGTGGSIITVSSVQATSNTPKVCAYATTKGAIITFTHTLAVDLAKYNMRANTICPGSIITPMQEHFAKLNGNGRSVEEMFEIFARPVPLQRLGHAWEIAELAAFLASPRSGFCTGAQFTADGGLLAGLRIV